MLIFGIGLYVTQGKVNHKNAQEGDPTVGRRESGRLWLTSFAEDQQTPYRHPLEDLGEPTGPANL